MLGGANSCSLCLGTFNRRSEEMCIAQAPLGRFALAIFPGRPRLNEVPAPLRTLVRIGQCWGPSQTPVRYRLVRASHRLA